MLNLMNGFLFVGVKRFLNYMSQNVDRCKIQNM